MSNGIDYCFEVKANSSVDGEKWLEADYDRVFRWWPIVERIWNQNESLTMPRPPLLGLNRR
jgi:hypothetical protein